jgi:hemolysin activation/secretion protein
LSVRKAVHFLLPSCSRARSIQCPCLTCLAGSPLPEYRVISLHSARQFPTTRILLFGAVLFLSAGAGLAQTQTNVNGRFLISLFRVHGAHALNALEVQTAVYPFLGPFRNKGDVQGACAALEKAYHEKGFGAASVTFGPRIEKGGAIDLYVKEGEVARLRVKGARYFSPDAIKDEAPSMAEGNVLNFNDVTKDIISLNQIPERTVTPVLQPGTVPGTYDIDLNVKDTSPTHASVEINDYRTPNTTPLRVLASASDNNLGQAGNGVGFSVEVAPVRPKDSEVFTGYYLARFPGVDGFSAMLQATKQDSNISTLGGSTVAGPGEIFELRLNWALPNGKDWNTGKDWENFSHSVYVAIDYKHFQQTINTTPDASTNTQAGTIVTPITYYPVTAGYMAYWKGLSDKNSATDVNLGVTFNFRGLGSGPAVFDLNRFGADGSFIYLRGTADHTANLPGDFQIYGRVEGQLANQPLVSSEEYSGGGQQTVRGYLESEEVGDDGAFATLEFRSPPFVSMLGKNVRDWRLYVFGDTGELTVLDPLPGQKSHFDLTSVGFGSRLAIGDHLTGAFDAGYPLTSQTYTIAHDLRMTFRVGASF